MRLGPETGGCPDRAVAPRLRHGTDHVVWPRRSERWEEQRTLVRDRRIGRCPGGAPESLASRTPSPADSIAVVTWNILIGGGDVPLFLEEVLGYQCHPTSPELEAGFSHFVLLIQEAHRRSEAIPDVPESFTFPPRIVPESAPEGWPDIVELARDCGLALFYVPSARNGPETIEGRAGGQGQRDPLDTPADGPARDRAAVRGRPKGGRRQRRLQTERAGPGSASTSVHLDVASTLYRTFKTANTARLRQATGLIEALALIETGGVTSGIVTVGSGETACGDLPGPIATVAAGDFNTWSAGESADGPDASVFPRLAAVGWEADLRLVSHRFHLLSPERGRASCVYGWVTKAYREALWVRPPGPDRVVRSQRVDLPRQGYGKPRVEWFWGWGGLTWSETGPSE